MNNILKVAILSIALGGTTALVASPAFADDNDRRDDRSYADQDRDNDNYRRGYGAGREDGRRSNDYDNGYRAGRDDERRDRDRDNDRNED